MSHSPFFTGNNSTKEDDTRHKEFENSIGNLLVAEYQVFRLRERIKNHLGSTGIEESSFMFKVGDEWYKINISAQKQFIPTEPNEEPKKQLPKVKSKRTTGFAPGPDEEAMYEAWFQEEENVGVP